MILWVLHLSSAISITDLQGYMGEITPMSQKELRNRLFCMTLAGWVGNYSYENKVYWYSKSPDDPISKYSFVSGALDPSGRKLIASGAIMKELVTPRHVLKHIATLKGVSR
jgi:hypothetical protein